jgi:hypothetical protein
MEVPPSQQKSDVQAQMPKSAMYRHICVKIGATSCPIIYGTSWSRVSKREFTFVCMGTPCTTFSRARQGPPWPVPLRTMHRIYGRHDSELSQADIEALKQGNYFALNSADVAWTCLHAMNGFGFENVEPYQSTLGAETSKPTRIAYSGIDLSILSKRCNHISKTWVYKDWSGRTQTKWNETPSLLGRCRESGEPDPRASSAYSYDLNKAIVQAIIR